VLKAGTLIDHFRVMRLIGRGGMGEVYLVRDTKLGRRAALKVISTEHLGSPEAVESFLAEARTTARFSHPNIVTIHAVGEYQGRPYVALEYLEGQNLRERVLERRPSLQEALRISLAVAEALREAHQNGVLHLDLKPENIVIPRDGRIRVVDFGLAKTFLLPDDESPMDGASAGVRAAGWGTPSYVAPEQWRYQECTGATDIWALGVILFELCSNRLPYPQPDVLEKGKAICSKKPAPRLDEHVDVPRELADLVAKCLQKDQAARATPQEVVETLEDLLVSRHGPTIEDNPFRGLAPYTQMHAPLFFGRDAEVAAFVERLRHEPVLTVVGPPGAGKSSFVQAGVIPRLREQDSWTVIRVRPGPQPFLNLAERLYRHRDTTEQRRRSLLTSSDDGMEALDPGTAGSSTSMARSAVEEDTTIEALAERLRGGPARLSVVLRTMAEEENSKVLLLVEQVEEIMTLVDDVDLRRRYMRAVCGAADDPSDPVRVVLTLRDDFLGRVALGPEAREALARVTVVQSLGQEALAEILTRPVAAVGYQFEDPELVREMTEAVVGQPGSLPLLQFAAAKLWEQRDQTKRMLLRSAYVAMGGVEGALAQHADGSLDSLSRAEQKIAREILLRLVTPQGTRRVIPEEDALDGLGEEGENVLTRLTQARLIAVKTRRSGATGPTVELVHESLLRTWTTLRRWLDEAKEDIAFVSEVTQAAQLWDKRGRQEQELWRGSAIAEAERLTARAAPELPALAREFLDASTERDRRAQRRRQLRWMLAVAILAIIAIGSALAAVYVADKEREALSQRDLAERQRSEAIRAASKAALERGHLLESRARLRSALELDDSPSARALWWQLGADPRLWTKQLGSLIYAVAYADDGSRIAAGSQDGSVYLFDPHTRETSILRGADDQVYAVAISPDGKSIAAGAWSGRIFVWTGDDLSPRLDLDSGGGAVRGLQWSPSGKELVSATLDGHLTLWSVDSGTAQHRAEVERSNLTAYSPAGDTIAIASADGLKLWKPGNDPEPTDVTESIWSVDWSPDGSVVATATADNNVVLWDVGRKEVRSKLRGHRAGIRGVAFSPDGELLASAAYDKTIRVWNVETGEATTTLEGHEAGVESVAFGPASKTLVSAGRDRTVRLWRLDSREKVKASPGHRSGVYRVAFSPDGTMIASASGDQTIRLWDVETGQQIRTLTGHTAGVDCVAFSPKGDMLASSSVDLTVRTWDVDSGAERRVFADNTTRVSTVAYDSEGARLAAASRDGHLTLYDLESGATLGRTLAHEGGTYGIAFAPNGPNLVTGGADGRVTLWATDPLRRVRSMKEHTSTVNGVSFGPLGQMVASGSSDRTVRVWNLLTGRVRAFGPHGGRVYWAEFDPAGRRIGAPVSDGSVTVWTIRDGSRVELSGHRDEVNSASFSPDGRWVVTGGDDGTVRLWNAEDGTPQWRAPLLLPKPARLLSHRGWLDLDKGTPTEGPQGAWVDHVRNAARFVSVGPNARFACVLDEAGGVSVWDTKTDQALARPDGSHFIEVVMGDKGCLARNVEGAVIVDRSGDTVNIELDGPIHAIGSANGGFLVVADEIHQIDDAGQSKQTWSRGPGVTAVARSGPYLLVGYSDGTLELRPAEKDAKPAATSFEQVAAARVERIVAGPDGTFAVGYGNGMIGLWNLEDGSRLSADQLHGRVVHLDMEGGNLYVATDLGDFLVLNLQVFYRDYCDLVREVWADIPIVWSQGRALSATSAGHRCDAG
jgi:WD40 repeat protein